MWIFLNNAFLSVVAHRKQADALCVRARLAGDIERVFPGAEVIRTPDADYLFRAVLPRRQVADAISASLASIEYFNFKDSLAYRDPRAVAYTRTWAIMNNMQYELAEAGDGRDY